MLPGVIQPSTVNVPVSHIDVFSTIMDYLDQGRLDRSDGSSLRRYIEGQSYNQVYDDRAVVSEMDKRVSIDSATFSDGKCCTLVKKAAHH